MPLESGQIFAGYTIVRLVGSGGMGEVYLAQHPRLPRQDALKVLPASFSSDEEFRERFSREADMAATLWHPHIVGVHDRGEFDGRLWISMDFVDGHDAARLLVERYPGGMHASDVVEIVTAVADALDYAHQRLLLHRDIKPANILLTGPERGRRRILLADFGIARRTDDVTGLTATNITVGSMSYTAPEQLMGHPMDGRADQYSLAATAFRLFTGAPPFPHSNPAVVISHHLNTAPPKLGDAKPELGVFDSVMARALAKDPAARFNTCHDFAAALAHAASSAVAPPMPAQPNLPPPMTYAAGPVSAYPPPPKPPPSPQSGPPVYHSPWTPTGGHPHTSVGFGAPPQRPPGPRRSSRRPFLIAAAVVGAIVLVAGGIFGVMQIGGSESSDRTVAASTSAPTSTRTTTRTTSSEAPPPPQPDGKAYTIANYIRDNRITETPIHKGDPNTPVVTLPMPQGWADAGPQTPEWAYSAIIYSSAPSSDPPTVISLVSELAGDVDAAKVLEYAPNELKNLPSYESEDASSGQLDGLDAVQVGGSYLRDGKRRAVTQKTAVIPVGEELFVLQINADGIYSDLPVIADVTTAIDQQTTITP